MSGHMAAQVQKMLHRVDRFTDEIRLPPITDWNEAKRYFSKGSTPFPGPFKRTTAPHMVEILERLHPNDPCNWITMLKSVQSTATAHAELGMAYIAAHSLGSMGFYTASKELAGIRSKANIDRMIDDTEGLAAMVKPLSTRNVRKKGDSTFLKEFMGGIKLTINTYGSIAGMKSMTMEYMFLDELDEAPPELKGQGDIISILEGRTLAVRDFKIMALSTPTAMDTSLIYRLFLEGDQRYYFVPCPLCGEMQVMVLMERTNSFGLTFLCERKSQIVIPDSVGYVCKHCKNKFGESKKQKMLLGGQWRPSVLAQDPKKHSYHISGMMSPEAMLSWERICVKWASTNEGKNILKYKDFTINIKGWPWARMKKHPEMSDFKENNLRNYNMGEVPPGGLMLVAGIDIQGDRGEILVMAIGPGFEKWLIDYKVFHGKMEDPKDLAWVGISDFIYNTTYPILGKQIRITKAAVDCGWDPKERRGKDWDDKGHTVYNFVGRRLDRFIPIRGSGVLKSFDVIKESRTDNPLCPKVYMLNSNLLKEILAREISLEKGASAVNFPQWRKMGDQRREIDDELIKQMLSERYQETKPGVMGWKKIRARNEVLDTWLYAEACGYHMGLDSWTDNVWMGYRNNVFA